MKQLVQFRSGSRQAQPSLPTSGRRTAPSRAGGIIARNSTISRSSLRITWFISSVVKP